MKQIKNKYKQNCGCFIQKWPLSRHTKTAKHTELLQAKTKLNRNKKKNKKVKIKNEIPVMLN